MNIIFFDIDGVLNHWNCKGFADWDIVERLKQMAIDCSAKLVMSSSWKDVFIHPDNYSEPDRKFPHRIVEEFGDLFIGHCPEIDDERRGEEVSAWLLDHPEVENFVILDDLDFDFPEIFPDNFVKTTGLAGEGFSREDEVRARKILIGE